MRLIEIKTKNYRTLKGINLSFSKSYCTLSGKNNAGKSSVIRLLSSLFLKGGEFPWMSNPFKFDYAEDRTQWLEHNEPIEVTYELELASQDDPALISFIEELTSKGACRHHLAQRSLPGN
jgi:putative ATP-dependent endonuclease of the OLD family